MFLHQRNSSLCVKQFAHSQLRIRTVLSAAMVSIDQVGEVANKLNPLQPSREHRLPWRIVRKQHAPKIDPMTLPLKCCTHTQAVPATLALPETLEVLCGSGNGTRVIPKKEPR